MPINKVSHSFKVMLSIPRTEVLTRTAQFTQWSALLAYGGGGLTMLCAPIIWHVTLNIDHSQRSRGYLRLAGCYLVALGFLYIVLSRSSSRAPGGVGPILASVLERLFYVNGAMLMMYTREMVPLWFAVLFILLDTSLALVTLILWYSETKDPTPGLFLKEIATALCARLHKSSFTSARAVLTAVGGVQLFSGLVLMTIPSQVKTMLHLDTFINGTFTSGFLSCTFLLISVHGVFHILAAGGPEGELAFGIAAVFYRVVLVLPILSILLALDQIEQHLALSLGSLEVAFVLAILISFFSKCKKNRASIKPRATGVSQTAMDE